MPRAPRLHVEGGFYHVILRGNHREAIFFTPGDRDRFASLLAEGIERFRMRAHAYCWMTNHVHLLIQVSDAPLGRAMMRIASRYARATQRRRATTGHLFERRHRAILVDADSYLLELIRYIHLNPVRSGMVTDPCEYQWSSHRAYLGAQATSWLTTDFALALFGRELTQAREAYRRFVLAGIGMSPDLQLSQGRSDEPRMLGDDRFLARVKMHWRARDRHSIDELIEHLCRRHEVDPADLTRPGRQRKPAQLRVLIVHHAIERRIATLSDLARRFGRSASTLCESLEHHRRVNRALFDEPLDL
jgi:REP element-mobilizing transposase RayT